MTGRILAVDDIEANIRLLQAKLQAEYYDVLTAHDGAAALVIAAREQPDLVLLDVMMPGMDGFETCRRMKDDPATRHIPVVLVTALDGRGDRITGLEAGADEFLNKPIDDIMLFARVKSLTRLKLVIDELRQREASGRRIGVIAGAASRLGGGGVEKLLDVLLGLADPFAEHVGGADAEEAGVELAGGGFGEHRFARAGRAVQQHPPAAADAELGGQFRVGEGVDHLQADVLLHVVQPGDVGEAEGGLFADEPFGGVAAAL